MKKNIFLSFFLTFVLLVSGCSCDKFSIDTYNSAVKNYMNSTMLDFSLDITTITEGSNILLSEESTYKFELTTTRKVENFASTIRKYETATNAYGPNGDPQPVYESNRYFKKDTQKFYVYVDSSITDTDSFDTTYEQQYDENSIYHINNIVPTFDEDEIKDFNIVKDKSKKGYSIATFKSVCPAAFECSSETVTYTVTMDKDFYFSKIEFVIENGKKTSTYVYKFNNYNNDVEIVFPGDLDTY